MGVYLKPRFENRGMARAVGLSGVRRGWWQLQVVGPGGASSLPASPIALGGGGKGGAGRLDVKSTRFLYFYGAPDLRGHSFVWPETPLESWFGPSGAMAAQPICNR